MYGEWEKQYGDIPSTAAQAIAPQAGGIVWHYIRVPHAGFPFSHI